MDIKLTSDQFCVVSKNGRLLMNIEGVNVSFETLKAMIYKASDEFTEDELHELYKTVCNAIAKRTM
jgi:hypothetical protein